MSYLYSCVTAVVSAPYWIVKHTAIIYKQARTHIQTIATLSQKERRAIQLTEECSGLTHTEICEYIHTYKFTQMLDDIMYYEGAIVLQDNDENIKYIEYKVHEYLAMAQLLPVNEYKELKSSLLHSAFNAIMSVSHTFSNTVNADNNTLQGAYILIENIVFNRICTIHSVLSSQYRQCVNINEMIQLCHIIEERLIAHKENTHTHYVQRANSLTHNRIVNIYSILGVYFSNLLKLHEVYDIVCIQQVYEIHTNLRRLNNTVVDYDILVATQVFAAIAAQQSIRYEMQRNFNNIENTYFNETTRHTSKLFTSQMSVLEQLRIAHIMRTYFTHTILTEFVRSTLALHINDSYVTELQRKNYAHTTLLLLNAKILHAITMDMSVQLTNYMRAAITICIYNKCCKKHNILHICKCRHTITAQMKNKIVNNAIHYIFNVFMPLCVHTKLKELCTQKTIDLSMLYTIVDNMNPLSTHSIALITYLKTQSMNALNSLLYTYLQQIDSNIVLRLTNNYHLLYERVQTIKVIVYTPQNVVCVMRVISQYLLDTQRDNEHSVMNKLITNMLTDIVNTQNIAILNTTILVHKQYGMHIIYALTHALTKRIRFARIVDNICDCGYILVTNCVWLMYNPRHLLCPLRFIHDALDAVIDVKLCSKYANRVL